MTLVKNLHNILIFNPTLLIRGSLVQVQQGERKVNSNVGLFYFTLFFLSSTSFSKY